jgi:hypothetical protein
MWEHFTSDSQILGCGKVYCSNSIVIINFVKTLLLPWFENVFPTYFGIEMP